MSGRFTLAAAFGAAGAIIAVVSAALGALLAAAPVSESSAWPPAGPIVRVLWFTVWQAGLSTALSVVPAILVARALSRRAFPGRTALLRLFGLPLVVPVIVAVFGIVAVYGRGGWVNGALGWLGFEPMPPIYGLGGILIAHVFFNLPLAVRLLIGAFAAIPHESWRLAHQLGLSSSQAFRFIEWPALGRALPGAALLIFFLCFTSFGVVLTLGGGPRSTIVEVAIFQALRLDFDVPRAVVLAVVQFVACAGLGGFLLATRRTTPMTPGVLAHRPRTIDTGMAGRAIDGVLIGAALVCVALPLAATIVRAGHGAWTEALGDASLWRAGARSLAVGLLAGVLAVILGIALALGVRELAARRCRPALAGALEMIGSATLVVSPLVLGAGLFVFALPFVGNSVVALGLVFVVDALLTVPYALRLLVEPMTRQAQAYDRLCASLGIAWLDRLRLIDGPELRRPAGLAFALAAALAAGDLGAIALFGTGDVETLALRLYRQIGAYRMDQAAVTAAVLVGLAALLFVGIERAVGGRERG